MPSNPTMGTGMRRRWAAQSLRIVFGAVWIVIAAEFFLRIFAPVPILPRYVASTDFGVRGNMANMTYWHRTPEYKIELRTNNRGIRADEDIPYMKPPGEQRIVVLGDSFGMGHGVNLEDTFLHQMNVRLHAAGYNTRIVNLSVSGHGTAEELLMLRHEGMRYDPDLILIAWHPSDLRNNQTTNLFALEAGELVRRNKSYLPAARIREKLFSYAAYRWVAGNSHLYTIIRERVASSVRAFLRGLQGSGRPVKQVAKQPEPTVKPVNHAQQDLAVALLVEIRNEGRENGANMVVLDIPTSLTRSEFQLSFPRDKDGGTFGFHVVDPIPAFVQHAGEMLYWEKSHGHFTPLGCRLVGESLARTILDEGLLNQ